jgi:hypothetical protein
MKKILSGLLAVSLSLAACDKDDLKKATQIEQDISYNETTEIPMGTGSGVPLPIGISANFLYAFATDYKTWLETYNTSADLVTSTKMKELTLKVVDPPSGNFNWMDTIRVYVSGDGLPEVLAAYKYPVPKGIQTLDLDIVDQNLKQYFLQDSVRIRLNGFVNALPAQGTKLNLGTTWHLVANPIR